MTRTLYVAAAVAPPDNRQGPCTQADRPVHSRARAPLGL